MKSTPILYSAPMVLARLAGRKTNTRRLVKLRDGTLPQEDDIARDFDESFQHFMDFSKAAPYWQPLPCPYGQPGDELWTRETFHISTMHHGRRGTTLEGHYLADLAPFIIPLTEAETHKARAWQRQDGTFPAIFMFRSLCRDTATITAIHAEQVKAISHVDARAEGIAQVGNLGLYQDYSGAGFELDSRSSYMTLWDSINAKRAPWESNPWVWSIHTTPHQNVPAVAPATLDSASPDDVMAG